MDGIILHCIIIIIIFRFDSITGNIISRGELDFTPTYLYYYNKHIYLSHGRNVTVFKPQYNK